MFQRLRFGFRRLTFLVLASVVAGGGAALAEFGGSSPSLPPPTGLTVSATPTSLTLNWQPVPYASGYGVYLDSQPAGGTVTTSWTFGNLQCGTSHKLEVDARRGRVRSAKAAITASTSDCPSSGPPVNTSPPTITGTPQQGQALTGGTGAWTGTQPISYAFQWFRCNASGGSCNAISGGTGHNYVLSSLDVGQTIRLTVAAKNSVASTSAQSDPTSVVQATGSSTFGTMSPGPYSDNATNNYKEVALFSAPQAGTVTKLTGYVSGLGATSGSQPVQAVIYADSRRRSWSAARRLQTGDRRGRSSLGVG